MPRIRRSAFRRGATVSAVCSLLLLNVMLADAQPVTADVGDNWQTTTQPVVQTAATTLPQVGMAPAAMTPPPTAITTATIAITTGTGAPKTGTVATTTETSPTKEPDVMDTISADRKARLAASSRADDFREDLTAPAKPYDDIESSKTLAAVKRTFPLSTLETRTSNPASQPRGSLSGQIMFLSGGHGWTNDNTSTTNWYTQRPATNGVVEDFGNLDQFNLFAEMCFRAGATVVPFRPLGHQLIERVVDNDAPQALFQGEWRDSESTVSFRFEEARVPYRFAVASKQETAIARYRPHIPKSDYYPVYCWSRAGADRVNQTYRVAHTGGVTEVQVDHQRVGNGWVYLGEYYFAAGDSGYAEITNQVADPYHADGRHVVIADAIRFGNGMGDISRGGGISGYPREEEASRYWVQRELSANVEPFYNAFDSTDQRTNVGAPPRMAAHMNRETEGGYFDRIFLSFHSNAVGGRGAMGLFSQTPSLRPDHQQTWAELTAKSLNDELGNRGLKLPVNWVTRNKLTDSHIDFGEIRRDYINNEMTATIIEVAFHDNPDDAKLLREPFVREAFARACLKASLTYIEQFTSASVPKRVMLPEGPVIMSAVQDTATTSVEVAWLAPRPPYQGASAPDSYRVCHSIDGNGFDGGRITTSGMRMRFDNVTTGPHYFRVTAINAGGESRPSASLGVNISGEMPQALLVIANGLSDLDDSLTQTATACLGSAHGKGGDFARIVPRLLDRRDQVPSLGKALEDLSIPFDSVAAESVAASPPSDGKYRLVLISLGRAKPTSLASFGPGLLAWAYRKSQQGAALVVSGSDALLHLAPAASAGPASLQSGLPDYFAKLTGLRVAGATTSTRELRGAANTAYSTHTVQLVAGALARFQPRAAAVFAPSGTATPILRYGGEYDQIAAMLSPRQPDRGPVLICGFPLEEVAAIPENAAFMRTMLKESGAVPTTSSAVRIQDSPPLTAETRSSRSVSPTSSKAAPTQPRRSKSRR